MNFLVSSETSKLKSVIIGIANSNGKIPHIDDLYDPKSIENLRKGTYPKESDMVLELESFVDVLQKHNVTVYRPKLINNYNQIFTRDVGFVIDNFFFKSNTCFKFEVKGFVTQTNLSIFRHSQIYS